MRHLSDDLIQKYLDSIEEERLTEIENHLAACFECQEKLTQYQELYRELSIDTVPLPDNSLNLNVLAEIRRLEAKKTSKLLVFSLSAFGSAAIVLLALSILGVFSWQGLVNSSKSLTTLLISPVFESMSIVAEKLNGNLELLFFAAVAVLVFQLLDYGFVKRQTHQI